MKRNGLFAIYLLLFTAACGPAMRIKPGELPAAEPPQASLKNTAEYYVAAHINQQNWKEIKNGPEYKRVTAIVERLSRAAGYQPGTFPVHLVDAGEEVNAAAFNGAAIVVYRELLRRVKSEEDLATVLSHEIGHILAKHYKDEAEEKSRAQSVGLGSSILGTAASIATSAVGYGGVSDLAGSVTESATGAIGYGAFVGSFSRTQEREADHLGLLIMAKAGYDPRSAVEFWKRSGEVFGSNPGTVQAFFSTHPASSDRQAALEEALPHALKFYPGGEKPKAARPNVSRSWPRFF